METERTGVAFARDPTYELRPEFRVAIPANPGERSHRIRVGCEDRAAPELVLPGGDEWGTDRSLPHDQRSFRSFLGPRKGEEIDRRNIARTNAAQNGTGITQVDTCMLMTLVFLRLVSQMDQQLGQLRDVLD